MSTSVTPRTPWLRWYILRTLLHKEVLRHAANRGGLALVLLLVVASLLLSVFGENNAQGGGGFVPTVQLCYVDYWDYDPWVAHLRNNQGELDPNIWFRAQDKVPKDANGRLVYPQNTGAIQVRPNPNRGQEGAPQYLIWIWYPAGNRNAMAPYEAWFWKETHRFAQIKMGPILAEHGSAIRSVIPSADTEQRDDELKGSLDPRSGMATALVIFGLFFVCVYLLPSLTCEERERGILLAQALSPASPREILAAKFLFYPVIGLLLAAILAGTYKPLVLTKPFFWLAVVVGVCGTMGVGLTIASIARTQRAASMGAMGYLGAVTLLLRICQESGIPFLPYLALEYHCPRMIHAVLSDAVHLYHWGSLITTAVLACIWAVVATVMFRRYGWQT